MPSEQSIRRRQGFYLEEAFSANLLGLHGESSALLINKPQSLSTQLLAQGSVFLLELLDDVLLMAFDPASKARENGPKPQIWSSPEHLKLRMFRFG